jgi:hypothetical protein
MSHRQTLCGAAAISISLRAYTATFSGSIPLGHFIASAPSPVTGRYP